MVRLSYYLIPPLDFELIYHWNGRHFAGFSLASDLDHSINVILLLHGCFLHMDADMAETALTAMVRSHEERLQRVESDLTDLTAGVASTEALTKEGNEKLERMEELILYKLSVAADGVAASVKVLSSHVTDQVELISKTLSDQNTAYAKANERVMALEKRIEKSDWLWTKIKQMAIPLAILSTALITKFGEFLVHMITGAS